MALSFVKKGSPAAAASTGSFKQPVKAAEAPKKSGSGLGFLKKGNAARAAIQAEEARIELAKQEAGKLWRYRMPVGVDRRITFLDGDLDKDGLLDISMFHEHTIRINGGYENFVCTAEIDQSQPCPLCEAGDRPSLVGVLTVIDHSEHVIQKGPNAGKVLKDQKKLFVAKMTTIKILTKKAEKLGTLAGCTFDVFRTTDKSPAVGDQFDFVERFESYDDIADKYGLKLDDVQPANYAEEIKYRSPEELIALGVGKSIKVASSLSTKKVSSEALADEL